MPVYLNAHLAFSLSRFIRGIKVQLSRSGDPALRADILNPLLSSTTFGPLKNLLGELLFS